VSTGDLNVTAGKASFGPPSAETIARRSSADLLESGIGSRVGINLRRSVNQLRQDPGHVCIGAAVVDFRASFAVLLRAAGLEGDVAQMHGHSTRTHNLSPWL
jgi:hypothetical protein